MQIGFDGADEIGIYCFGKLIARIGPDDYIKSKGVIKCVR